MDDTLFGPSTIPYLPDATAMNAVAVPWNLNFGICSIKNSKIQRGHKAVINWDANLTVSEVLSTSETGQDVRIKSMPKLLFQKQFESVGITTSDGCQFNNHLESTGQTQVANVAGADDENGFYSHWCSVSFPACRFTGARVGNKMKASEEFLATCSALLNKPYISKNDVEELWAEFGRVYIHSCVLGLAAYAYVQQQYESLEEALRNEAKVLQAFETFCPNGTVSEQYPFFLRVVGGCTAADNRIRTLEPFKTDWKAWRVIEVEEVRPVWMLLPKEMQEEFKRKTWHVWPHLLNGKPVLRWFDSPTEFRLIKQQERIDSDDAVYVGEVADGVMNGYGVKTYESGAVFEGKWVDGKQQGKGKRKYDNGNVFEGELKDDVRNGYGVVHYANGNKYEGEFLNNKLTSKKAKFTWANGSVYEGELSLLSLTMRCYPRNFSFLHIAAMEIV